MLFDFLRGFRPLFAGIGLIFHPGFKRYVIVPLVLNVLLLCVVFAIGFHFFSLFFSYLTGFFGLPEWILAFISWIVSVFFFLLCLFVGGFFFSVLTTTLAAPFYGLLSQKAEQYYRKNSNTLQSKTPKKNPEKTIGLLKEIGPVLKRTVLREARKLGYLLPWILIGLSLMVFPLTLPFSAFIWFLISSWMIAIQYLDYPADNRNFSFIEVVGILNKNKMSVLGFGASIAVCLPIPILNLLIPPASVIGATYFWDSLEKRTRVK